MPISLRSKQAMICGLRQLVRNKQTDPKVRWSAIRMLAELESEQKPDYSRKTERNHNRIRNLLGMPEETGLPEQKETESGMVPQ